MKIKKGQLLELDDKSMKVVLRLTGKMGAIDDTVEKLVDKKVILVEEIDIIVKKTYPNIGNYQIRGRERSIKSLEDVEQEEIKCENTST